MKKITFFVAACTLCAAVSCSQDESQEIASSAAENEIGFISNTTRAEILTLTSLEGDPAGFVVYGTKGESDSWDGEMNGENYYAYGGSDWGWTVSNPKWPTEETDYPVDFFAFYMLDDSGATITNNSKSLLAITYAAPTDGQTDILVATASADARPVGDKLALTFNHILSKVNFNIVAGDGYTVYTQAVGLNNICSERKYQLSSSAWTAQDESKVDNYSYLDTQTPAISSDEDEDEDGVSDGITGTYGNLMLLPQSTTSWQPVEGSTEIVGSHIYMLYRLEKSGADVIGYADAASHPNYDPETDYEYNEVPLFVKVGYPLGDTDFVLEAGKSYNYNINIATDGATNGYLIADNYYDDEGDETPFDVKGVDISDPLSDGYINFVVYVTSWDETTVTAE